MAFKWTKAGDVSTAHVGPFVVTIAPKGDGRWVWTIKTGPNPNPTATGVAQSFGAAQRTAENYVSRSGHV